MQRSFSIVEDNDILDVEDTSKEEGNKNFTYRVDLSDEDSNENDSSPKRAFSRQAMKPEALPRQKLTNSGKKLHRNQSDSEDSDNEEKSKIPGEYDPTLYENLDVDEETGEIFQYISKYVPQQLSLDYKFKPFIPEFLPAVGDIDAFLKVIPPETTLSGETFDEHILPLGLTVLDEPAANQSDPALLHLQLRAASGTPSDNQNKNIVVKKVEDVEKNGKVIEKWIKDISDLHKSKSSPIVRYSEQMPDLDDLMQEWQEDKEMLLKQNGFPKPEEDQSLSEYINVVCEFLGIPSTKNKIQSLHMLFSLYAAMKQTQLYQAASEKKNKPQENKNETADQLVLD